MREDAKRTLEEASRAALPVARLGILVAASNGAKRLDDIEEQLNPYGQILYQQQAAEEMDPAIARLFLELMSENKVPMWAVSMIDLKLLRAAAKG